MRVREVRMFVHNRRMPVPMGMPRPWGDRVGVFVLVVFIMDMRVCMFKLFMNVLVFVPLRDVEPYAKRHKKPGNDQRDGNRIAHQDSKNSTEEWCDGEIGTGAGRT